ncbi:hypothetical protein D918_09175 [Trichuris suis]|nr:hypothetical protein D918_09175 [Trichuris suis]
MERMNSISPKCNELKHKYDACFNEWFAERFLKGDSEDVCQPIFQLYQECIKKALAEQNVDCSEIDRHIIGMEPSEQSGSSAARFDNLEQSLEALIENTRQLCMVASDFQASSQSVLNQKLQAITSGLQDLDSKKSKFHDVKVPIELLEYVDSGKNPQLYTRDCIERTVAKNKELNSKIDQYKKFRCMLLSELTEEFPKETIQYRTIREYPSRP